ncbi:MAG: potassium-transporting ATPase subunit KdpA [Gemmatimonadetes bacterium]|nr:potassium-transporting ATPase subunit KdpA [Gemmatimonadota bacterium]
MTPNGWLQVGIFAVLVIGGGALLGRHLARVLDGSRTIFSRLLDPVERALLRLAGTGRDDEMTWRRYATALVLFSAAGFAVVYLLQRLQGALPLNPAGLGAVDPDLAFNTAWSFVSNTNWQAYGGEVTLSHLTQMLGLTAQNFVSAASGIAVLAALTRGFVRRETATIGNFWVDLTRVTLHLLLPLATVVALLLASQGVVQTLDARLTVTPLDQATATTQVIPVGPAASQVAIKQLGTNGGGFFNVNSAHPLENPTPFSNLVQLVSILLIPAACVFAFGTLLRDKRQGWALLAAMSIIFAGALAVTWPAEQAGTPALASAGAALGGSELTPGGNMEGKEVRFGITNSALWAVTTTAASNGSVNAMHDSFTPLGGMAPMVLMQLGEVVFGGVGSGLYGMLLFALVAVFVSGLMVGRTPEYLGKKIEAFEMKMAMVGILVPCLMVLVGTALAVATALGRAGVFNPGAHGFSEVLYALSSAANNNGSAFGGLGADTPFYNSMLGIAMFAGRFFIAIPVLALAGALAAKKSVPPSSGTLPTHTPLFVGLLVGTVLLVGALTFVPALALGPIVEQLQMVAAGVAP